MVNLQDEAHAPFTQHTVDPILAGQYSTRLKRFFGCGGHVCGIVFDRENLSRPCLGVLESATGKIWSEPVFFVWHRVLS